MSFLEYKQDGATPPKLKAITVNGAILVESEADRKKKEEKRKERRSRWDQTSSRNSKVILINLISWVFIWVFFRCSHRYVFFNLFLKRSLKF